MSQYTARTNKAIRDLRVHLILTCLSRLSWLVRMTVRAGTAAMLGLGRGNDVACGQMGHQEEEQGIARNVKIKIH